MPLTREQLRARLEHELDAHEHVMVSKSVTDALGLAGRGDSARASLALVLAEAVTPTGHYVGPAKQAEATERWAVLLPADAAPMFVHRCEANEPPVTRVLSQIAVLDVDDEHGLVIAELAPGHSARQLQEAAEPTLKVGSTLTEMLVVASAT
ncbi:MAG: hypothetical protein VB934_20960 [Polyangiaceae bacterium]